MSWSYDESLGTDRDKVRFLIDDTDDLDQILTNEEITFSLTQHGGIYRTAAALCGTIALKFSKQVGILDSRGVNWSPAEQAKKYSDLAQRFLSMASEAGGTGLFAGGISVADKQSQEDDDDRVQPAFHVDQHRNPTSLEDVDTEVSV